MVFHKNAQKTSKNTQRLSIKHEEYEDVHVCIYKRKEKKTKTRLSKFVVNCKRKLAQVLFKPSSFNFWQDYKMY